MTRKATLLLLMFLLIPSILYANDLVNHANGWFQLPILQKAEYVLGYQAGYLDGVAQPLNMYVTSGRTVPKDIMNLYNECYIKFTVYNNPEVIIKTMDSLYANPANSYIDLATIASVAGDKLLGKDIERSLSDVRTIVTGGMEALEEKLKTELKNK